MAEWALLDHLRAMDQIEAAERLALQSALLYTNGRHLAENERGGYERALDLAAKGGKSQRRAPRITPAMLGRLAESGIRVMPPDEDEKEVTETP